MKTTAVTVAAILASTVFAQPYHGRHLHKKNLHKREYVTTWVTQTETATLIIDQYGTSLVEPSPGQFYPSTSEGTTSTTSTSTSTSTSSSSTSTSTTSTPTTSTSTTPTSTYVQPTIQAQETTSTTTSVAPVYTPTTSAAAAPTSTSGSGSTGGGNSGDITFYDLGLGSCGVQLGGMTPTGASADSPAVVALSHFDMNNPANPNTNPLCGKLIKITANGRTGYGKVLDTCEGCNSGSIDVNVQAFEHFYDSSGVGRASVSWVWA